VKEKGKIKTRNLDVEITQNKESRGISKGTQK